MSSPPLTLSSILSNTHQISSHSSPLLLISSESHSLSPLPLIKHFLASSEHQPVLLISALHAPAKLLPGSKKGEVEVIDLTGCVPGYEDEDGQGGERGVMEELEREVGGVMSRLGNKPMTIIIDSPATLATNFGSNSLLSIFIANLLSRLDSIGAPSLLILPLPPSSPLTSLLTPPSLSPTLTHLTIHPASILTHIQQTYALLPPTPRFHNLLRSEASRRVGDNLPPPSTDSGGGDGWGGGVVVELVARGRKGKEGVKRGVEALRKVQGGGKEGEEKLETVGWEKLPGLEGLRTAGGPAEGGPGSELEDKPSSSSFSSAGPPTPLSSFNLTLTDSQRESRATVPVPYAHEGSDDESDAEPEDDTDSRAGKKAGGFVYEPDSGDDMDEDDPDEDLEF